MIKDDVENVYELCTEYNFPTSSKEVNYKMQ